MAHRPWFGSILLLVSLLALSACTKKNGTEDMTAELNPIDLYGVMLAFNPNNGLGGPDMIPTLEQEGWLGFRSDEDRFAEFLGNFDTRVDRYIPLAKATQFSIDREIPGAFAWNVIEPEQAAGYRWEVADAVVTAANESGMSVSGLIHPFAAWDQDSKPAGCTGLDFAYYDYKADAPTDWDAYEAFLIATVERYDGDGEDDMPGLIFPIKHWEIGNEYDGTCGGNLNEADRYFELIKISSATIKQVDPTANVINMGALELNSNVRDIRSFWEEFFALGGGAYIDIFNFHYNREKFGIDATSKQFEDHLDFFNTVMQTNDAVKPLWITEFGTYSGSPELKNQAGPGSRPQTETKQAAWYFRYSVIAFANGVEKIFVDLVGKDNDTVGGSALHSDEGESRAFLATLQTLSTYLEGFSAVDELADGQYRFTVNDDRVYALWDGALPAEITGDVEVIALDGTIQTMDTQAVNFSREQPVLIRSQ